jgi:hypothetical protein
MPSQPQSSAANDQLINDSKTKEQAQSSFTTGADAMTVEERETEREAISRARPDGYWRVISQQRLPAEGIGAAGGRIRSAFTHAPDQPSAIKRVSSGEYAGERHNREPERRTQDVASQEEIRC